MVTKSLKIFSIFLLAGLLLFAADNGKTLKVGDKIPSFSAKNENGEVWQSNKVVGKKNLVVYFFPAAMTEGCIKQACAYRDTMDQIEDYNTKVVGVSGDSVETLQVFKNEYMLKFTLLADPSGKIAKKFGVPVSGGGKTVKNIDGTLKEFKRGATFERWTFVINKEGKIVYKEENVLPGEDSKNILKVIKNIESKDK